MRRRSGWFLPVVGLACLSLQCGGGDKNPTAPSTPSVVQVAGVWIGTATANSVTGGGCVGSALQVLVGVTDSYTASINQTGSSLTATVTTQQAGTSCSYSGTAGSSTVSLNMTSCQIDVLLGVQCPNGSARDLRLVAGAVTGSVNGTSMTGTAAETWNVFLAGTSTGAGVLTLNSSFSVTRQ